MKKFLSLITLSIICAGVIAQKTIGIAAGLPTTPLATVTLSTCGNSGSNIVMTPTLMNNITQTQWFKNGQPFKAVTPNANNVITMSTPLQQNGFVGRSVVFSAMDNAGNIYTLHNGSYSENVNARFGYILKYEKIGSGFPNAPNIVVGSSNPPQLAAFGGSQRGLEVISVRNLVSHSFGVRCL